MFMYWSCEWDELYFGTEILMLYCMLFYYNLYAEHQRLTIELGADI